MNMGEAQAELNTLRKSIEEKLNDFHKRTGLIVEVYVSHVDVTEFGHTRRNVIHQVEVRGSLRDGEQ